MVRASGTERARRSSFGTTSVSPARTAAKAWSEAGTGAGRAGEPTVRVDALGRNPELFKGGPLGGEVLLVGGAAGVADQGRGHGDKCTLGLPSVIASAYHLCETLVRLGLATLGHRGGTVRWPIPLRTPALAWWPARRGRHASGRNSGILASERGAAQAMARLAVSRRRSCSQLRPLSISQIAHTMAWSERQNFGFLQGSS
jgi:hypothetical protein